jgi:hypothetical protein
MRIRLFVYAALFICNAIVMSLCAGWIADLPASALHCIAFCWFVTLSVVCLSAGVWCSFSFILYKPTPDVISYVEPKPRYKDWRDINS